MTRSPPPLATIGITLFLVGGGEIIFGGENKQMISDELGIPDGSIELNPFDGVQRVIEFDRFGDTKSPAYFTVVRQGKFVLVE